MFTSMAAFRDRLNFGFVFVVGLKRAIFGGKLAVERP